MRLLAIMSCLLWPSLALAGESGGDGLLPAALKMMTALVVVLGIILLLYALSRKKPGLFSPAKAGVIKVLETRYLGPKRALCLVEVRGEEFLLGMGQDRVELISRIDRKNAPSFEETLQSQELIR
jgi:flagellar protein FliO/FliZ